VKIAFEMRTPMERAAPAELKFWINGKEAATGTVQRTVPATFTASETFDVGMDTCSPVADDYFDKAPFKFEGSTSGPAPGEARRPGGRMMVETVREESSPRSVGNGGERLLPCAVSANMK
jgi:hypothetical protein